MPVRGFGALGQVKAGGAWSFRLCWLMSLGWRDRLALPSCGSMRDHAVWMVVELLHGSPCTAAEGVGLLEDGFNALGPAGGFCAGTAGYFLLAHN